MHVFPCPKGGTWDTQFVLYKETGEKIGGNARKGIPRCGVPFFNGFGWCAGYSIYLKEAMALASSSLTSNTV
jgi:hypothetical protein